MHRALVYEIRLISIEFLNLSFSFSAPPISLNCDFPMVRAYDVGTPPYLLAGSIYGPSYISFEYALSYYGMIPEAVYIVTCATFDKKKKYETAFGTFTSQKS